MPNSSSFYKSTHTHSVFISVFPRGQQRFKDWNSETLFPFVGSSYFSIDEMRREAERQFQFQVMSIWPLDVRHFGTRSATRSEASERRPRQVHNMEQVPVKRHTDTTTRQNVRNQVAANINNRIRPVNSVGPPAEDVVGRCVCLVGGRSVSATVGRRVKISTGGCDGNVNDMPWSRNGSLLEIYGAFVRMLLLMTLPSPDPDSP
jgi:hypothetical protein